jgi:hypothetical protein
VRETIGISSRLLRFFLASNPAGAILLLPQPWKGVCPQGLDTELDQIPQKFRQVEAERRIRHHYFTSSVSA